jgi:hypothetical protein
MNELKPRDGAVPATVKTLDALDQLASLHSKAESVELSVGTVPINQIKLMKKGGHHGLVLAREIKLKLQQVKTSGEEKDVIKIALDILLSCADPDQPLYPHLTGLLKHITEMNDNQIGELTLADISIILLKTIEVNVDFFMQATPMLLEKATALLNRLQK